LGSHSTWIPEPVSVAIVPTVTETVATSTLNLPGTWNALSSAPKFPLVTAVSAASRSTSTSNLPRTPVRVALNPPPMVRLAELTPTATVTARVVPRSWTSARLTDGPSMWIGPRSKPFDAVCASGLSVAIVNVVREAAFCTPPAVQRLATKLTVTTPEPNICCTDVPVAGLSV